MISMMRRHGLLRNWAYGFARFVLALFFDLVILDDVRAALLPDGCRTRFLTGAISARCGFARSEIHFGFDGEFGNFAINNSFY
jgi:hypothetical protein